MGEEIKKFKSSYLLQGYMVGGDPLGSTPFLRSLSCAPSMLWGRSQVAFRAVQEAGHQNSCHLRKKWRKTSVSEADTGQTLLTVIIKAVHVVERCPAFRSPRERWHSLGKRSEFVGGGLRGICRDRVADLMLPLTGNAAAGGEEERGKRQASEDGPEETDKTQREKKEKTLMTLKLVCRRWIYDEIKRIHEVFFLNKQNRITHKKLFSWWSKTEPI